MRAPILAALSLWLCATPGQAHGVTLSGIITPLAVKAQEIVSVCGSVVLYLAVAHAHVSLGGREDGLRFRHGMHRHASRHRHHRRYASAR